MTSNTLKLKCTVANATLVSAYSEHERQTPVDSLKVAELGPTY